MVKSFRLILSAVFLLSVTGWADTVISVGDGPWSAAGTWSGGVPADGDTVVITEGTTVIFDVNQAGFNTGIDLTINGTLDCAADAGFYYLKCSANIDGNGLLKAGTDTDTPLPSDVTFTIDLNDNKFGASIDLDVQLFCTEPNYKYVSFLNDRSSGASFIEIDTDISGDIWTVGDTIVISRISNKRAIIRTIDAISTNAILLAWPLDDDFYAGSLICLMSRNIRIINCTNKYVASAISGWDIHCEFSNCYRIFNYCTSLTVGGAVATTDLYAFYGCDNCTLVGTFAPATTSAYACCAMLSNSMTAEANAVIAGWQVGFGGGYSNKNLGLIFGAFNGFGDERGSTNLGHIKGCNAGIYACHDMYVTGRITHCGTNIDYGAGYKISNVRFEDTIDHDLYRVTSGTLVNCGFNKEPDTADFGDYAGVTRREWSYVESIDHNQVPGNFKAWCKGGVVVSDELIKPDGRTRSYNHIGESNDYPVFRQQQVLVEAGKRLQVNVWMRKDCFMSYPPRVQVINPYADPLIDPSQLPLDEVTLSSTDSWEAAMLSWTNTADTAVNVIIRGLMKNAGGNFWEEWEVLPATIPD